MDYFKNLEKLIEYNFKDSLLCSQILDKLELLNLIMSRSIITSTPLNKINSPIASLDIMYLKELKKKIKLQRVILIIIELAQLKGLM